MAAPPAEPRSIARARFLTANGWSEGDAVPLAADASFRRYFRLVSDGRRAVLMDAPPQFERPDAYVAVAEILRGFGLSTPEIYAADLNDGFLLIEDFGDDTYTRLLARGADETALYTLAIETLAALQRAVAASGLPRVPDYEMDRLLTEASLLVDWYVPAALGATVPLEFRETYLALWRNALELAAPSQPTLVLRDYHVDNLIRLPGRDGVRACGLLDFQDALIGSPAYDLVSLLADARRDVSAPLRRAMTERYLAAFPQLDRRLFLRSAAVLAAQRNTKIIGLFVRLWQRDGKPAYLCHLPRVWRLLEADLAAEPALAPIATWLDRHVPAGARHLAMTRAA
jgi:aminoglycoside/choline kinase family phosphotransferase